LGTVLLWAYYDNSTSQLFPQDKIDAIKRRSAHLGGPLCPNINPAQKIQGIPSDDAGVLVITVIDDEDHTLRLIRI